VSFISYDDIEYLPPAPAPEARRPLGSNATILSPGALSLPEDLWNAGQQTNDFINGMSAAVAAVTSWKGKNVPAGTGASFDAFRKEWAEFYGNNLSSRPQLLAHAFTSNLSNNLRNYQEQAATWAKNLKKWGVAVPGIAPAMAGGSNVFMWIGVGAVALVGLFVLGKFLHTVALGNAELTEAEDEAMKIADEKARQKRLRAPVRRSSNI